MAETILVADNEPGILRFVEVNLRLDGFDVLCAEEGEQALRMAEEQVPSLVILDIKMPGLSGLEVCRRLRAQSRTAHVPIIILTANALTLDKVDGLAAGADDYVVKPFDPAELVARVRTTLRRTRELRSTSPLTGMPGNHRIDAEIARRLDEGEELALVYADLNDFKPFNDRYGFLRGDEVIMMTGGILRAALEEHAGGDAFAGHIGGDDFMMLCAPEDVPSVCDRVIEEFDGEIRGLYDPDDAARGYLEVADRRGVPQRFPIMSIALGVATTERRSFASHREMVETATEMKSYLKQRRHGSAYAIDGRTDGDDWAAAAGREEAAGARAPATGRVPRRVAW